MNVSNYNCFMKNLFHLLYELSLFLKFEKFAYFFFLKTIKKTNLVTPVIYLVNHQKTITIYDSGDLRSNLFLINPSKNILDIN